jgi:hypothetical protein
VVAVLPEKVLVWMVLGRPVVFVILALVGEVESQHSEPRKMAALIQVFEPLVLMVLSVELKPIVRERCLLVE